MTRWWVSVSERERVGNRSGRDLWEEKVGEILGRVFSCGFQAVDVAPRGWRSEGEVGGRRSKVALNEGRGAASCQPEIAER